MRVFTAILGAAILTACAANTQNEASEVAPEAAAIAGYDEAAWFIADGWPGEYPDNFAVEEAGVTVMARTEMKPAAPRDVACSLPQNATYSPWNEVRIMADKLAFVTASPRVNVTFPNGASLLGVTGNALESSETKLDLPAGGQLTYLSYIAEGWAIIEYDGTQYELNIGEFPEDAIYEPETTQDDQWVRVTCTDGVQAWILFSDVKGAAGIGHYNYTGYGVASDLQP